MQTLVPVGSFEQKARSLLGDTGFDELLESLAKRPEAGPVIRGTGGLRKLRFARPGKGKRSGVRVIYYYHSTGKPILLLLIYARADQDNLADAQKAQLRKHVTAIIDAFS